ncbi:MAG: DMSO/selenate family reductase complex B subunit [bacterium]
MTIQYGFYINSSVCSGCKACQIACRDKNNLEDSRLWRKVIEVCGGDWSIQGDAWRQTIFAYHISMACNHCEDPICVKVCPTKSISKRDDGIVLINENTCVGCRYCEWACPYGAPRYNEKTGTMTKCNLCYDRIDNNQLPVCVSACGLRALEFGEITDLRSKEDRTAVIYPFPEAALTQPACVIKPHHNASRSCKTPTEIVNREELK